MRTIRRLYFYGVAAVSLEIVLWGLIGLIRSILGPNTVGGSVSLLARGLALILVGLPVFLLHWGIAQRGTVDPDERSSGVRAVFLYGVLLGTLIPVVQNLLAVVNRFLLTQMSLSPVNAAFGGGQSLPDNAIAVLMNSLLAAYFFSILRSDWKAAADKDNLTILRRVYRFIWVIYSLALLTGGLVVIVRFILQSGTDLPAFIRNVQLASGFSLVVPGVLLWYFSWKTVQDSLPDRQERQSLLRLGILYLLTLIGLVTAAVSAAVAVSILLRLLFGEEMSGTQLLQLLSGPLATFIPFAGIWLYHNLWLNKAMAEIPDAPRRAGMRRLYFYLLALIGLVATFTGITLLFSFLVDTNLNLYVLGESLRIRLAGSIAALLAATPIWLLTWQPMQTEAFSTAEDGDHARRSLVRRIYLYVVLFACVVGGMISAVSLVFNLLRAALGDPPSGLLQTELKLGQILLLFALLGVYHGLALRKDGRLSARALADRHARFHCLILDPGEAGYVQTLTDAIRKQAPQLPLTVHPAVKSVPAAALKKYKAVVLPADTALNAPSALREWLNKFPGSKVLIARPAPGWFWAGGIRQSMQQNAAQAALALRRMAEGQENLMRESSNAWMVVVYIAAGLFGLEVLFMIISLLGSIGLFD